MIMYGVLIMLVVQCLEDVGCGCEETLPYVACSTRSHKAEKVMAGGGDNSAFVVINLMLTSLFIKRSN
jgi:hypothetical protein